MQLVNLSQRSQPLIDIPASLVVQRAYDVLLILVAIIYSGAFLFLTLISPYLLYGFYLALLVLSALCLAFDPCALRNLKRIAPYLYFLVAYAIWGSLISPSKDAVLPDVIRVFSRNILMLMAVMVASSRMRNLVILLRWIHVAMIVNFAIGVWESTDPALILMITRTRDAYTTAFDVLRPAGLWINPDEAAFAFLFGLLLTIQNRSRWAWVGRIAAIGGIYLSASRTGVYILALYGIVFLGARLKTIAINPTRLSALFFSLALLLMLGYGTYAILGDLDFSSVDNFQITRIMDVTETSARDGYGRSDLTAAVVETVLDAPVQGYGIFAMQDATITTTQLSATSLGRLSIGAHNIYLVIWGEVGFLGLLGYLAVLGGGMLTMLKARLSTANRRIASLLWLTYLLIGFAWHNQFTDVVGLIYIGLLFCFPHIIAENPDIPPSIA